MTKMNPGMTQSSNGTPDKLCPMIFFNGRLTNANRITGIANSRIRLGINRFCHSQSRRFNRARINLNLSRQTLNPTDPGVPVFSHSDRSSIHRMRYELHQRRHFVSDRRNGKYCLTGSGIQLLPH